MIQNTQSHARRFSRLQVVSMQKSIDYDEDQDCKSLPEEEILQFFKPVSFLDNYLRFIEGNLKIRESLIRIKFHNSYGFQATYTILTRDKLIFYSNSSRKKYIGSLSLKHFKFSILFDKYIIKLAFSDYARVVELKFDDGIECIQWFKCLTAVHSKHKNEKKPWMREIDQYFYVAMLVINYQSDIIMEEEFLKVVETGDILLFVTENAGAKLQRMVTSSKYDHVAIIMRLSPDMVAILDSNQDSVMGQQIYNQGGVTMLGWSEFIKINDLYTKIVLRKLINVNRKQLEEDIYFFYSQVFGTKYSVTASKLMKQRSLTPENQKKEDGYFCSELVAKCFKHCGLLVSEKASSRFWPVTFSEEKNLELTSPALLDKEIVITLKKHEHL